MTSEALTKTADYLANLRLDNRRVEELPAALMPDDLDAAYRVQDLLVARLQAAWGGRTAGYKVAVTNPAAQAMLGVPHPVYGQIQSSRLHESGVTLSASDYAVCIIECEFGFRIASDVPASGGEFEKDSIAEFVGSAMAAIELVEFHFAAIDKVTPLSLAADNAIHGAWIHGEERTDWRSHDLASIATELRVNGKTKLTGSGDRVLGHPLAPVAWLANIVPKHGHALRKGDYITTGVTTDAVYPACAGDEIVASLGPVGSVMLRFT